MKKKKITKKKKQPKLSTIRNKLFKLWSTAVLTHNNYTCEYCGIKKGEISHNGNTTKIDAHHFFSRDVKDAILKFDIRNGVAACPTCHKFGSESFHRNPIVTIQWMINNKDERYDFVLNNWMIKVDLDNRAVLAEIEEKLNKQEPLDIENLIKIEMLNPRKKKSIKPNFEGDIFDTLNEEDNYQSSSSSED